MRASKIIVAACIGILSMVSVAAAQTKTTDSDRKRARIDKIEGGEAVVLKGVKAGLPISSVRGAQRITLRQMSRMKAVPKPGVYLVDTDFIPHDMREDLAKDDLVITDDGSVRDKAGRPVTLFVQSEVLQVKRRKGGWYSPSNIGQSFAGLFVNEAHAASPYPFDRYSWRGYYWFADSCWHNLKVRTIAEAWGPVQSSGSRPHTKIQSIETRSSADQTAKFNTCSNCDYQTSLAVADVGTQCLPAPPRSVCHDQFWKEGSFTASRHRCYWVDRF